jgi:hypothetical protein
MNFEEYFSPYPCDGDDGYSFPVSEREWHAYLATVDVEVERFFRLFLERKCFSNHLDSIFAEMKWEMIDFGQEEPVGEDSAEVATFHKTAVNIASRAIFFFIEVIWDIFVGECKDLEAAVCWRFSKILATMQREMVAGVANVGAFEYVLGVCHFKNVIVATHEALAAIGSLPEVSGPLAGFVRDFTIALFDIRELAWQGIVLCRMAEKYNDDGQQP